jgi:hypothetical protein
MVGEPSRLAASGAHKLRRPTEPLDAGRRCRSVKNRFPPSAALTAGLFLASVAFLLWAVQITAFDQGPLHGNAEAVLAESPAHDAMIQRVAGAVATAGTPMTTTAIATLANRTLEQPEFVSAFAGALDRVQEHVVAGTTGPITLDPVLVTQAVRAAAADDEQLAPAQAITTPVVVEVSTDEIPDLARWANLWEAAGRVLAFLSLLLITYGLLRIEHRVWAMGRIGRWAIVVGVATLAVFWVIPRALLRPLGGWIAVGGAVATSSDLLVPVSLVLVAAGAVAVITAHRWEEHDRKRVLSAIPRTPTRSTAGPSHWESPV